MSDNVIRPLAFDQNAKSMLERAFGSVQAWTCPGVVKRNYVITFDKDWPENGYRLSYREWGHDRVIHALEPFATHEAAVDEVVRLETGDATLGKDK